MLTPGDSTLNDPAALDPSFTLGPAMWLEGHPAIRQKILEVDEAFRTTIALFGTDAEAELPEPILLLHHLPDGPKFADFRALTATAFRRSAQRLSEATDVWSVAETEVLRALEAIDRFRQARLRDLHDSFSQWRQMIASMASKAWLVAHRREFVPANPVAILDRLDLALEDLLSTQQLLRAGVLRTAAIIEDWIDTVRSVDLLSAEEQQHARREQLAELRQKFPGSIAGIRVQPSIDDGIKAALDVGDVVVIGESTDTATRHYLVSQMNTLAQKNVGAILVQVPHDLQETLTRFARERNNRSELINGLRSAGIGGGEALADMVAAAADHGIRVVAFDTRWGRGAEPVHVQIKNHYMAARLTQTLGELEGQKIVALVKNEHTDTKRGLDALIGGVSFDERSTLPAGTMADRRGEIAFGGVAIPQRSDGDDSDFMFNPSR